MEITATGSAAARRMRSCASQPVESTKALHAKTAVMMLLSLKKTDNDSWSFRHCGWDINNSEYYISMWNKSCFINVRVSVAVFQILGACVWNIYMPTNQLKITKKNSDVTPHKLLKARFKKIDFSTIIYRYLNVRRVLHGSWISIF